MLRPADLVGATDWVTLRWATPLTRSVSGLPCRGKFRPPVTRQTCPLPIQSNGKLLNQTPFILEERELRISYTERTAVAAIRNWERAVQVSIYQMAARWPKFKAIRRSRTLPLVRCWQANAAPIMVEPNTHRVRTWRRQSRRSQHKAQRSGQRRAKTTSQHRGDRATKRGKSERRPATR